MIQKRFSLLLIWILVSFAGQAQGESTSPYSFDKNGIKKEVLENYLDRSITVTNLLVPNQRATQRRYPHDTEYRSQILGTFHSPVGKRTDIKRPYFLDESRTDHPKNARK